MGTGADVQRQVDRARSLRRLAAFGALVNAFLIVADLAGGSVPAIPAAALVVFLVLVLMQTHTIRTLERVRELNRHAGRLELAAKILTPAARPSCAHPAAEPVDLFNPSTGKYDGERVGWVCPECNADLPAGWKPSRGTGTMAASGGTFPSVAALSGTGSLTVKPWYDGTGQSTTVHFAGGGVVSAQGGGGGTGGTVFVCPHPVEPACDCGDHPGINAVSAPMTGPGGRWRPLSELLELNARAAGHFADLAAEGRESCVVPAECPMCTERDRATRSVAWDDVAYPSEASQHFAALARVGLEHCASYCPICLHRLFGPVPDGVKPDASMRQWLEENWGWKQ